jgi:hypothetical protein
MKGDDCRAWEYTALRVLYDALDFGSIRLGNQKRASHEDHEQTRRQQSRRASGDQHLSLKDHQL